MILLERNAFDRTRLVSFERLRHSEPPKIGQKGAMNCENIVIAVIIVTFDDAHVRREV